MKKKVIIVGGGTSGVIIANRLQKYFDVTVIEKSKYKNYPFIYRIPSLIAYLFRAKQLKYVISRELKILNNRSIPYWESNTYGGASVINGCVHVLGSTKLWKTFLAKFNVTYDDLLQSYKDIYAQNNNEKYKINLSSSYQNIIDTAFMDVLYSNNILSGDTNKADTQTCGPVLNTVNKFFRTSVLSVVSKKNFKLNLQEQVERIIFDNNGKTIGVSTNLRKIESDYIILSAGVIGTCDILLREKKRKNIYLKHSAVGEDIQDHTNLRINVLTNKKIGSFNEVSSSFALKAQLLIKHFFGLPTLIKGTGATSAVHLDLDNDGTIDTRVQVVQFNETGRHGSDGKFFSSSKPGFSFSITPINPKSRGTITINGVKNVIDPNYLSDERDVEILKKALSFCLKLLKSKPLSDHVLKIEDLDVIEKDPKKYILDNIYSGAHLSGGTQNLIDNDFKVKNTNNLFICDASIFDGYLASNMHSSVVLMADIFAKKFLEKNKIITN